MSPKRVKQKPLIEFPLDRLCRQVADAAKKHDLASLMLGMQVATAAYNLDWGFTMIIAGNDGILITKALRNEFGRGTQEVAGVEGERRAGDRGR